MTGDAVAWPRRGALGLRGQVVVFIAARLVINTGHRMVYPFLPTFARGLGVDFETIALAVTARSGLGLVSPVFGVLGDRYGRRLAMLAGLGAFAAGMLVMAIWPSVPAFFLAFMLAGVGKHLFDPAMQAYIGDRVRYSRRGLAIAVTEVSWSGAFLLIIPLLGWLIGRLDTWQVPFALLAASSAVAAALLWRLIPSDATGEGPRPSFASGIGLVLAHRAARAGIGVGFCISAANETIGIIYGAWLEDAFGLKVTALGLSAIVIGLAELAGEGGVAGFVDRIGKRQAIGLGIGLNAAAALLLPAIGVSTAGALAGLFLVYLTFEFAVVSAIPLMTELVPTARATLLAANVAAFSAGRMTGALLGPLLFGAGLMANGVAAALLDLGALVLLIRYVREE